MKREIVFITAIAALLLGLVLAMGCVGGFETGVLTTCQFLIRGGVAMFTFWISTCLFDYARFI